MILIEHNGEHNGEQNTALPASDWWLLEPGPVWYTPAAKKGQANGVALPARLVRPLGDSAWVVLLRPEGGWKRLQARNERLAPRREVLEIDHVWATHLGTNGGASTTAAREVPGGAVNRTPARAQPASTSPRAGLSIAAEPSPAPTGPAASGQGPGLRCPHCGTASASSRKFRNAADLLRHTEWCSAVLRRSTAATPDPADVAAPAPAVPAGETPLSCPHCGITGGRTGGHFRSARDLRFHVLWCARRMHAEAAEPSPASTDSQPLRCPDCGTTRTRSGGRFLNEADLLRHRRWHQKRAYFARAPLPPLLPNEPIPPVGRTAPMHPPASPAGPDAVAPAAPDLLQCIYCGATGSNHGKRGRKFRNATDLCQHQNWCAHRPQDAAAEPLQCPDCGTTSSTRGTKFRDPQDLLQHRKRCPLRAARADAPAEASAPEVHQNGHAPARSAAPAAAPENGSAAQPSPAQAVRFCAGCELNLEVLPMPVRFCPACGLGTAAIHAALSLARAT